MLIPLIQFLLIFSFILLPAIPVAFVVLAGHYFLNRTHGRGVLITGSFILGALVSVLVVWRLVPSEWSLPFWTTLQAAVDAQKYGHPVEHYAEGFVLILLVAGALGGAVGAGVAALSAKPRRNIVHA
ncbi:membrane hypothetical protein [Candidatus Sulfopaludibacter sp. SbA3]|nr:membrane hypothetical protein [Candidatus Sulfopaludibacter sp. SbA3]